MNILILTLYSPTKTNFKEGIGGAQEVIYQLGKRWVERGHSVKIISAYRNKRIPKGEKLDGIEIDRVGNFYTAILPIKKAYKKEEKWADIVVENYTSYPLYTPLYVKKPLVVLTHHLMGSDYIKAVGLIRGLIGYFSEMSIPLFYRHVKFISVSRLAKAQLIKLKIPDKNIETISNGIDTTYFIPGEEEKNPTIFFVGSFMDGRKRVEDLIKAFKIISKEILDARLIIAGKGGDKEIVVRKAAKSNSKIKYLGLIDMETKKRFYQKAWVFVNPSMAEGFSLSCLEANACGTPCVVYNLGGLETLQNGVNGLVVRQGNVDELANAIMELLSNHELREEMSRNARKIAERFSWDRATEEYLRVMEEMKRSSNE
jgi:glycosyltransferase involved in cell wall biosynthesis